jgi:hypothetical protein
MASTIPLNVNFNDDKVIIKDFIEKEQDLLLLQAQENVLIDLSAVHSVGYIMLK